VHRASVFLGEAINLQSPMHTRSDFTGGKTATEKTETFPIRRRAERKNVSRKKKKLELRATQSIVSTSSVHAAKRELKIVKWNDKISAARQLNLSEMKEWIKISMVLCTFGFFRELRPSEPYVFEFLTGEWRNVTSEQVNREIYPIGTYSYLAQLCIVFLITDILR
jgi:Reduced folate carrier